MHSLLRVLWPILINQVEAIEWTLASPKGTIGGKMRGILDDVEET